MPTFIVEYSVDGADGDETALGVERDCDEEESELGHLHPVPDRADVEPTLRADDAQLERDDDKREQRAQDL